MSELPFAFFMSERLVIIHPEENCNVTGYENIRLGKRVRKRIANQNGVQWYLYFTLRALTAYGCSFALELARNPHDGGKNIEMYLSVWDTKEFRSLKLQVFEKELQSGDRSVCLTEDCMFRFASKNLTIQFHGTFRVFNLSTNDSVKEVLEEQEHVFISCQNGCKSDGTFTASNKLSEDFRKCLEDITTTDVTFKCGSDTLYAHKLILSARSPVFEAMFKNKMLESSTGLVDIEDISAETFRNMLIYIYTGKIDTLTISTACEGLYASEKYQQHEMKQACIDFLKCSLSIDVVLNVFRYADMYDKGLRQYVIKYIHRNFHSIQTSESWKDFESDNPPAAIEILKSVINFI